MKKLVSVLVALIMVFAMGTVAFAEGTTVEVGTLAELQDAIDNAVSGTTIKLTAAITGDVTVVQKPDTEIIIDGDSKEFTGTITVNGKSAAYDTAALTIKNVNFIAATDSVCISLGVSGDNNTRYTNHVTVDKCTFTGTDNTAAAIKNYTGGCKNVTVTNCTATGMHSLLQLKTSVGVTVSGCNVIEGKNGISLGASSNVEIIDCKIEATGYGVRADANADNASATISDCEIEAFIPVVVRNATEEYDLAFEGENKMEATNEDGAWCAIGKTEYEEGVGLPEDATGDVKVSFNDTNLNATGISGIDTEAIAVNVAKIVDVDNEEKYYETLEEALKAVKENDTVVLLSDVTVSDTWDCRNNGAKITANNVTIDGKSHTIKLTGAVDDKNWNTVFRFEGDNATVKNLTIDVSEATGVQRGISSKLSITVENCKFFGNGTSAKRAIIFGEGAGNAISNVTAKVTGSDFSNWSYGISDNQNAQDAKAVTATGNTFENASVLISASEKIEFTDNKLDNGYVNISSYSASNELAVTATGNELDSDYAEYNSIEAKTIEADEGFSIDVCEYYSADGELKENHDWDEGKITKEPDCEHKGEKTFTCQRDETHTRTEKVDALGHEYGRWVKVYEPTETEPGVKVKTCHECGKKVYADVAPLSEDGIEELGPGAEKPETEQNPNTGAPVFAPAVILVSAAAAFFKKR